VEKTLETLNTLIGIIGATATLQDAVDWLQVEENAEKLLAEGHENDPQPNKG
jgi:hypothetical protein